LESSSKGVPKIVIGSLMDIPFIRVLFNNAEFLVRVPGDWDVVEAKKNLVKDLPHEFINLIRTIPTSKAQYIPAEKCEDTIKSPSKISEPTTPVEKEHPETTGDDEAMLLKVFEETISEHDARKEMLRKDMMMTALRNIGIPAFSGNCESDVFSAVSGLLSGAMNVSPSLLKEKDTIEKKSPVFPNKCENCSSCKDDNCANSGTHMLGECECERCSKCIACKSCNACPDDKCSNVIFKPKEIVENTPSVENCVSSGECLSEEENKGGSCVGDVCMVSKRPDSWTLCMEDECTRGMTKDGVFMCDSRNVTITDDPDNE